MEAPKEVSQEEVMSRVQKDIEASFAEIEELLPLLGHGEAKRLFIAATKYPLEDTDFSSETNEAVVKAYSASKTVKDALVALGVEVVIKQMVENQRAEQSVRVVEGEENE